VTISESRDVRLTDLALRTPTSEPAVKLENVELFQNGDP
jgi:hypothetical protein